MTAPRLVLALLTLIYLPQVTAEPRHDPAMHATHKAGAAVDGRVVVKFPQAMREHTLTNMRDHLLALQQIQSALAKQEFDMAADIAEQRLGLSSLALHGAHDSSKYMPKGMQETGSGMHRNASRFAVVAKDAAATGDVKPALAALAQVTAQCVACHAGWRLK